MILRGIYARLPGAQGRTMPLDYCISRGVCESGYFHIMIHGLIVFLPILLS